MKKLMIQSRLAREVQDRLRDMGHPKALKALKKALGRGSLKSAGQTRPQGRVSAKAPFIHRQFNAAMQEKVKPILLKSVAAGELDPFECAKIETQINRSIQNPFFQLDRKYADFLNGKLKANGWAGGLL